MLTPNKHWPSLTEGTLDRPIPLEIISNITGNAPLFIKEAAVMWYRLLGIRGESSYGHSMRKRVELKEVSLEPSPDDPKKISTKMVCELEVVPDMCNSQGIMSQGCMVFLMDEGSAISLLLMKLTEGGDDAEDHVIGVSQTLNMFFHHGAPGPGSKILIVNRSVSTQGDIGSCQSEIWDVKNHRLIVTSAQLQMMPSSGTESSQK